MATKNSTRISSLLGTWTGQTHLKTAIGSYELEAYFVMHFMPDPMRAYSCELEGCNEVENHSCMLNEKGDGECKDIPNTVLDWSDVSAFLYFGAKIDVGFPFNKRRAQDTGGWIGPMNIIMAKDALRLEDSSNVVDRYVSRFVESPSTEFITMPKNCTLLREADFRKIAGVDAVRETAKGQFDPNANAGTDPYDKYLNTCKNGDVKPLLPLFQFDFVQDEDTKEETVDVKLDYKLMSMPHKKDYMYDIFPKIQGKVNRMGFGFHISGPYCYGDDPKRAYSFDMDFDTKNPKKMLKLEHACIEGLPCSPPAADFYGNSGTSNIDVKPLPDDSVSVNIFSTLFLVVLSSLLVVLLLLLFRSNRNLKARLAEIEHIGNVDNSDGDRISTPFEIMEDSESTPLISNPEEEEIILAEEGDEGSVAIINAGEEGAESTNIENGS